MRIELKKYGKILVSRQDGREAYSVMSSYLTQGLAQDEAIEIDFSGVNVLSPGWADEVITKIAVNSKNLKLINITNPSVKATLKFLEEINGYKFNTK